MKTNMTKVLTMLLVLVLLAAPAAAFAEEGVTYEIGAAIDVGTKIYEVSSLEYTVYTFDPTEVGKYTISSTNSVLGIVSYNGMWVTVEPTATTVAESSVKWDCKDVGQGIWVAALSKAEGVNITVKRDDIVIQTQETIHYANQVKPQAFKYEGDAAALEYVDVEDGKKDGAVLGADGFYHLNDANGPILYASLNDSMLSIYNMREPGQIIALVRNEDNSVKYKVDYNAAFDEYWACVDSATGLYPLTVDLILLFKNVGDFHGWYGADGWLAIDSEDGWMFACQYLEGESFVDNEIKGEEGGKTDDDIGGIISDGGDGGITEDSVVGPLVNGNSNTNNTPGNAQTGDVVMVLVIAVAASVAAVAAIVLFIRKKRSALDI